jgi:hypothetical protein
MIAQWSTSLRVVTVLSGTHVYVDDEKLKLCVLYLWRLVVYQVVSKEVSPTRGTSETLSVAARVRSLMPGLL